MAYTTLAQGSSAVITITDQFDGLEVINRSQDLATVALTSGAWSYGATPQQHSGRRVYQLTGAGSITLTASSGSLQYELTDAADNRVAQSFTVAETSSIRSLVSTPWKRPLKPRTKAARIFAPRTGTFTTNASGTTFATTMAAARRFDACQVVLHNAGASAIQIDACTVAMCSGADTNSKLMGGGQTIVTVTFDNGSATSTIPAAAANRRSYKVSDIIDASAVEAVDRDDGGTLHLINARHYTAQAAASISTIGDGTDDYTNWRTVADGRLWVSRQMNGNQTATIGSGWSTTDISQTTIAGFIFYYEGQVVSIGVTGDSTAFGFGSTNKGAGLVSWLAGRYQGVGGVAVETINIARSGASTDAYKYGIADLIAAGIVPDVMLMGGGTINDLSPTVAAANVRKWRRWLTIQMAQCWDAGCVPVPMTVPPTTSAAKAMAATDALRVAHNADLMSWRARGQPVIDLSAAVGGSATGTGGQIEPSVAAAADGVHPTAEAYAAAGAYAVTELAPLFAPA
jgi:lysophospholipase L1-like esterase